MATLERTSTQEGRPPRDDLYRAVYQPEVAQLRAAEGDAAPMLYGHFAMFNEWAEVDSAYEGHFLERVAPGATLKTISENRRNMKVMFHHGLDVSMGKQLLGDVNSPDAQLFEDEYGPYYEVPLFEGIPPLIMAGLRAGVYGVSYRFAVVRDDYVQHPPRSEHNPRGLPERTIQEMRVREFGPTPIPVQEKATAAVRSLTDEMFIERVRSDPERAERFSVALQPPPTNTMAGTASSNPSASADVEVRIAAEGSEAREYRRAWEYLHSTPWEIEEAALHTIYAILAERRAGERPTPEQIRERIGTRAEPADPAPGSPVEVINVMGPIVPHGPALQETSSGTLVGIEGVREQFRAALANEDVGAIMFRFDTPGGSVDGVGELTSEIMAARGKKPIWAMADAWAASAGYHLAVAADEIVVTPSGKVGSIGVISVHQDMSAALEQKGVRPTLVTAGRYKGEADPSQPLSEEAQAHMQEQVDSYYEMFVKAVAKGRGTTVAKVRSGFGEGRMVMAAKAVAEGMADRVATFDQALAALEKVVAAQSKRSEDDPPEAEPQADANEVITVAEHATEPDRSVGTTPPLEPDRPDGTTQAASQTGERTETMLVEERRARLKEIDGRLNDLHDEAGGDALGTDAQEEWDGLKAEAKQHDAAIANHAERTSTLRALAGTGTGEAEPRPEPSNSNGGGDRFAVQIGRPSRLVPDDPYDLAGYRAKASNAEEMAEGMHEGALRIIDREVIPHPDADQVASKGRIEFLLGTVDRQPNDEGKRAVLAERVIATTSKTYRRAFAKAVMHEHLTPEEDRALSLTTTAGGFAVPVTLDPTVILTSNGVVNPLRQIARVETITGNTWQGITSAGITAAYTAEATEASDANPVLAQPVANVEKAQAFVPYSIEIGQDWGSLESEMARMFQDAKDTVEADKFLTGVGHASNVPEGLLVGATVVVSTAAATTLTVADLYSLDEALPPRWEPRASILGNRKQFNRVRAFDTSGGSSLWVQLGDGLPRTLLGLPNYQYSNMTNALTSGASILTKGDFTQFLIVDRVGLDVELIPHLFGGSNRFPTGQRALYAYWRNTSKVLTNKAFVTLKVT